MKRTSNRREKTIMLLLAVMAIGMFALPSTLAMYTGQHDFVNGSNVECAKCHGTGDAIYEEMNNSDMHANFSCRDCHGYQSVSLGASPNTNNSTGHAGTLGVMCLDCHSDARASALPILAAYDMDENGVEIVAEFEMATAAHDDMYRAFNSSDLDDMCIACHTEAAFGINTSQIQVNASAYQSLNLSEFTYGEDNY